MRRHRCLGGIDWTARVLVGGLKPARAYWYRFTDADGNGSRVGRTTHRAGWRTIRGRSTSPSSAVRSVNEGKLNAYRRMIFEDERARPEDQLGFVLHLGDFIYEVVEYPDEVKTRYDRTDLRGRAAFPTAGRIGNFHYSADARRLSRGLSSGYLADPDLQDARARWPFVAIWDNHEFSWQGWQSILKPGDGGRPGQSLKVAANQAWWEYLPVALQEGERTIAGTISIRPR